MADLSIAIIGLGRLGASVGLALKRYQEQSKASNTFDVTGVDRLSAVERAAKQIGAVHRTEGSVAAAVQGKDLVVLAAPYAETQEIFQDVADGIRDGAVVMDFSPLKLPSIQWGADHLPATAHIIGATAVANPIYLWDGLDDTEHARADYFDGGAIVLSPAAKDNPDAIELVTSFATILGATVHYVDPTEHDGLIAATEGVPAVLSVAAFRALSGTDGWSEAQRLTNPAFGRLTHRLMDTHPDDLRDLLLNNSDNVVRYLDTVIDTLTGLRAVIADQDRDALEAAVIDAEERYGLWLKQRSQGKWDDLLDQPRPQGGSMLSGMLGGFLSDRLFGRNDSDKDK